MRPAPLIVAVFILFPAFAQAQPSACHDADIVFVARAEPAVTFHISGEPFIERARVNLQRVEEDVARERAALDYRSRMERNIEFELRLMEARKELDMRRAMYVPPYDLTLIPMQVEQAFRGVAESNVMLLGRDLSVHVEPNDAYLIVGHRSNNLLPPLPEMADLNHIKDYIEAMRVTPAASAQREIDFLRATRSGATILGTLTRQLWGDGPTAPIGGIRIIARSGAETVETTTNEDGSFVISGIPAGAIEIRVALSDDLTIFNRSALKLTVREGTCTYAGLRASVNGRVRGRMMSASGGSVKDATAVLYSINLAEFLLNPSVESVSAHAPRLQVTVAEDGTFELFGVPPGTYLLIAWLPKVDDGKSRTITTYYPGTSERSDAVPLTVGNATVHEGFDFVVRTE